MIQGRVFVGFTVNKDGHVSDLSIKKGVHRLLDSEALRVVGTIPAYIPGRQNDKAVRVSIIVPVSFRIMVVDSSPVSTDLPRFPGGAQAMNDFIKTNIRRDKNIRLFLGKVPVAFDVDEKGKVSNVYTSIAMPGYIDSEAVRVVSSMPDFIPAEKDGKKIARSVNLKVSFFDERYVVDSNGFYNGTALDENPSFIGGLPKKKEFFEKYFLKYESMRQKDKALIVMLTINTDSTVSDIVVTDGINSAADKEIKSLMSNLSRLNPGVYYGKPVKTRAFFAIDSVSPILAGPSLIEAMPRFPGGEQKLMRFIQTNINYPVDERDKDIQGTVVVGFTITESGKISDISVKKHISPGIDREALRVVSLLPDFIPASQQGKAVKIQFMLPINFKLAEE